MNTDGHKLYQTIMNNHAAKAKIAGAATYLFFHRRLFHRVAQQQKHRHPVW
jgi:hypothetical protein